MAYNPLPTPVSILGSVQVLNFPASQPITTGDSSVIAVIQGSVATSITPVANQSVSGTVGANLFVGGNVVTTSNPVPISPPLSGSLSVTQVGSVIAVQQGSVGAVIIGGSIAASFTPPANQSVSGTVGASVVGHAPVVIVGGSILTSATANQSVSGTVGASVVGTVPVTQSGTVITSIAGIPQASVHGIVAATQLAGSVLSVTSPANQSVSGTVGASVLGHAPVVIVGGSILTSSTPNQSVSGSVGIEGTPTVLQLAGSVLSANIANTNLNVGGSVVAFQGAGWSGSVAAVQSGTRITSVVSTVPSSVLVGASIFGQLPAGTAVLGSVATLQGTNPWNIAGSVAAIQTGTWRTSLVSSTPSSVIVGASIFGLAPVNVTNTNLNVGGSVVGFQGGTWSPSAISYVLRNDAVASALGANLTYRPQASDSAGRAVVKPFAPEESRVEGYNSVVSGSVTTLVPAAGAGLKNYITDIILVNTGAATTLVTFRSGGGASVLGYGIAPTGGGSNMLGFATPMMTLANQTFDMQASTSTSVLYATVKGFKAP